MTKPTPRKTRAQRPAAKPVDVVQEAALDVPQVDEETEVLNAQEETPAAVETEQSQISDAAPNDPPFEPDAPVADDEDADDGGFDQLFSEPPVVDAVTQPVAPQDNPADEGIREKDEGERSAVPVSSDDEGKVLLAGVEAPIRSIPIGVVQAVVGDELMDRARGLNGRIVSDLQSRMRGTDGRCAPMIFTVVDPDDLDEVPTFYAGVEILAAAIATGMSSVFVVVLSQSEAQRVQGVIGTSMHLIKDSKDDEFVWRGMRRVSSVSPA